MKSKICKECHCSIVRPHHELIFWFKCPICGFTLFDPDMLSEQDKKLAKKNRFATNADLLDERVWKPKLDDED